MSTMYSRITIAGHPVHPMLVAFPVTFYTTTFVCFSVYSVTADPFFWHIALWSNLLGVCTAAVAAVPGFIDWWTGVPRRTSARTAGRMHMLLNLSALALFTTNLIVHRGRWGEIRAVARAAVPEAVALPDPGVALMLTALGFFCTLAAGYLGWSLVQTHHVGVELSPAQRRHEPLRIPRPSILHPPQRRTRGDAGRPPAAPP